MNDRKVEIIMLPKILKDIIDERSRQVTKWGFQQHPDGTGKATFKTFEEAAKSMNEHERAHGDLSWASILEEEFWEALATTNQKDLRDELVQVAAVCAAWIEDLDNRKKGVG